MLFWVKIYQKITKEHRAEAFKIIFAHCNNDFIVSLFTFVLKIDQKSDIGSKTKMRMGVERYIIADGFKTILYFILAKFRN